MFTQVTVLHEEHKEAKDRKGTRRGLPLRDQTRRIQRVIRRHVKEVGWAFFPGRT